MNRLMKECKSESSNHLVQLLSHTSSSQQLHPMEVKDPTFPNQEGIKVSSLSIVLLVRIAQVSIPDSRSESLVQTFRETKEVIHFIDKTISTKSFENNDKLLFARAVWKGPDFNCLLPRIFASASEPSSDLDRAVVIITNLKRVLPLDLVRRELGYIMEFINRRTYSSIEDLYTFIEQLFVDILHTLLTQLPVAIFKLLTESPVEEFEGRATLAFKLLCKLESLEGKVQWSYPVGCNISRLVGGEAPATQRSMESLEEGIDLFTTDVNNHDLTIHDDVITVV
ncbi:hypothetical protein FRX31_009495 [Thalictrum thalictroides]|uniref:Uncharacterized protein n=1 Tax=Thalictrum thalictroides TaxID=46969 RepID=A0A7J6WVI2_THATH|nr:hypothetical protein FRX31_009495 [Thalictrum thalictroides]